LFGRDSDDAARIPEKGTSADDPGWLLWAGAAASGVEPTMSYLPMIMGILVPLLLLTIGSIRYF